MSKTAADSLASYGRFLDTQNLGRTLTKREKRMLLHLLRSTNGSGVNPPAIHKLILHSNFHVGSGGVPHGFVAQFYREGAVHPDLISHDAYRTRMLFPVENAHRATSEATETGAASGEAPVRVPLSTDSLRCAARLNTLGAAVLENVPDGAIGFSTAIRNDKGRYDDRDAVAAMGTTGDGRVGVLQYQVETGMFEKKFCVMVDVCQPGGAEEMTAAVDRACVEGLSYGEMLSDPATKNIFAFGEMVGFRGARAMAETVADALSLDFERVGMDEGAVKTRTVPVPAVCTVTNLFYNGPGTECVSFYNDVVRTDMGRGAVLFKRQATLGYFAVLGERPPCSNYGNCEQLFKRVAWKSTRSANGLPSDIGRAHRLSVLPAEKYLLCNIPNLPPATARSTFTWDGDPQLQHALCQMLYLGEDGAAAHEKFERHLSEALKRCSDESVQTCRLPLIPVIMKLTSTPTFDLAVVAGDTITDDAF
jgi:hypothetical protein